MITGTAIGNLGRDAEVKVTPGGKSVCNFSIAARGRDKNQTTWIRCALWGARGEKVAQYLTKGGRVAATGTISTREHDGKTYLEMDVSELELLGDKPQAQDSPPPPRQAPGAGRRAPQQRQDDFGSYGGDDEIPF